jgi:hypothetical protein
MIKKTKVRFVARLWYYFRMGYATYLTFLLGAVQTLVVVWYLAIKDTPALANLFGHFVPFAVVVSAVGIPPTILVGWLHLKRSPAYSSELDIGVEANPYNYKFPPGFALEAIGPWYLELLLMMRRLLESEQLLTSEDKTRLRELEQKLRILNKGGFVGNPRRNL